MAEPLEQQLVFDISPALASIESVDAQLQQVVANFSSGLVSAVEQLASAPLAVVADTSAVAADIAALSDETVTLPVEADVATAEEAIEALERGDEIVVSVDADTSAAVSEVDAIGGETATVPIDADVAQAEDAIAALEGETVQISVEADASGAIDSIGGLGDVTGDTSGRIADLSAVTSGFSAVATVGQGQVGGLTEGVGALGGKAGVLAPALAVGGATLGFFFAQAVGAESAVLRLHQSMGPLATRIENLDVGNLNADLSELAVSLGSDDDALRNVAATLFNFQTGAGTARVEASAFAETVLVLSARSVALNPALGKIEDVAGRLGNVLGRGGRFASQFGLDLASADIKARAAENATRGLGDGVSFASLQLAGGQLAIEKYGDTLAEKIAQGTENPIIQLRALRQSFEESAEEIGKPLIAPIFEVLEASLPVAVQVAEVLGKLGEVVLPVLAGAAPLLTPLVAVLGAVADGLGAIAAVIDLIPGPVITVVSAIGLLAVAAQTVVPALTAMATAGTLSLGPGGWALLGIGALAALGSAVGLFGGEADRAATDTSGLAKVFVTTTGAASTMKAVLGEAASGVDAYIREQLALESHGISGTEILARFGATFADVDKALTGSTDDFDRWNESLRLSHPAVGDEREAVFAFGETLFDSRIQLQENAAATIAAAVATGTLTQAQVDAAIGHTRDAAGNRDNISALRELTPVIDGARRVTNEAALAAAEGTPAYAALVQQLASGAITVDEFGHALEGLGLDTSSATEQAQDLSDQITTFADGVRAALPTAQTAFDDYTQTVQDDLAAVSEAVESGKGDVHALFEQLVADSDPAKFTENMAALVTAILGFDQSLATIAAQGAPQLAAFLGGLGPEAGGAIAQSFAGDEAKARAAEGVIALLGHAQTTATDNAATRYAAFLAAGGTQAEAIALGIEGGAPRVGAAVQSLGAGVAERFQPNFSHRVSISMQQAAVALANDPTVGQAAGEKGLAALRAFEAAFGPASTATAARVALGGAHDAIEKDPTLKAAGGQKGKDTADEFGKKAKVSDAATVAFDAAKTTIAKITTVSQAAGSMGHVVGTTFGTGIGQGIVDRIPDVMEAARRAVRAAEAAARTQAESTSPSKVAMRIGRDWTTGLALGIRDTTLVSASGAVIVGALTASTTTAMAGFGPQITAAVVEGFNDPATIAAAIARLEQLVAQATTRATDAPVSAVVSSALSQLPGSAAAISEFGQAVASAAANQAQALATYHEAYTIYNADRAKIPPLLERERAATQRLHDAQLRLFSDTVSGLPKSRLEEDARAVANAQRALDSIQDQLSRARGQVREDQGAIGEAQAGLSAAQRALAAASNPDQFIKNLNRQTVANREFRADIARLSKLGFTDLAEELARAGPEVAGKLADALASNPAKARSAEAAVDNAAAFAENYEEFLEKQFGPKVAATAAQVGVAVGASISAGFSATTSTFAPAALAVRPKVEPIPALAPLHVSVVPHLQPLNAAAINVAPQQLVTAGGSSIAGPQVIELDIDITLPSGETVTAQRSFQLSSSAQKQVLKASVDAKVKAG